MSRPDASEGDMANFLRSLSGGRPFQGDEHLEDLLSGQPLPENADAELHGVNELLTALRSAPADPVERPGQARALDAYRETFATSDPAHQRRRRPAMIGTLIGAKLGAALAAGAVGFGGIAVAAAAGVLPDAAQNLAHTTFNAPAAGSHGKSADHIKTADTTKATPVGPDATAEGHAAFGLCTAWTHAKDSGKAAEKSIAFRNLATAAGSQDGIAAYCLTVAKPSVDGTESDTAGKPDTAGKSGVTPGKPDTAGKSNVVPGTPPVKP
ncbi:MAG: hypothetical protein HHJ11_02050 [Phycicoccus sp.]|nr:hypothetical protein [Phycicoccus sp.]NMM33346.1 hypothetical protein [Phycicoccus sp.]